MTKVLQSNEISITPKEKQPQKELAREEIEKLFQMVKRELEYKKNKQ